MSFNTQPPEGGCPFTSPLKLGDVCFNTQPPEGGCDRLNVPALLRPSFNTQPPEGGCSVRILTTSHQAVSTHSHPKVAAICLLSKSHQSLGFNTQPPEGGCFAQWLGDTINPKVSTHSHPKVAAYPPQAFLTPCVSFNTQPPEGGCKRGDKWRVEIYKFQHTATRRWLPSATAFINSSSLFQHTATRRWLHQCDHLVPLATPVSTHSHPKVAA